MRFLLLVLGVSLIAACAGPENITGTPDRDSRQYYYASYYLGGEMRSAYFPRQPQLHPYGEYGR